jgi:hypothetical protein
MLDVGEVGIWRLARAVRRARDVEHCFVLLHTRYAPISLEVTQPLAVLRAMELVT